MKNIMLDAGHGGTDCGAESGDVLEKNISLDIVLATEKKLLSLLPREDNVILTRIQDKEVSLTHRYEAIMSFKPDAFISVHCNSIEDNPETLQDERQMVEGLEIFFRDDNDLPLAKEVMKILNRSGLWRKNRGIKQDIEWLEKRITVLNSLEIPSILVEVGFISNDRERRIILENKDAIADLLAHGINNYLYGETHK
jgi:N-acetylmuramoyl-L-alanine amidase